MDNMHFKQKQTLPAFDEGMKRNILSVVSMSFHFEQEKFHYTFSFSYYNVWTYLSPYTPALQAHTTDSIRCKTRIFRLLKNFLRVEVAHLTSWTLFLFCF